MRKLAFLMVLLSFVLACQKNYNKTKHAYQFIPNTASAVFKVNELSDFIISIDNHDILSSLYSDELKSTSKFLKYFNTRKQVYISINNTSEKNSDYLILTKSDSTLFIVDSIPNRISETLANFDIEKTQIDSSIMYHKNIGTVFAGSNNLELLKSLDQANENLVLSKLIETTDNKSVASLIFKPDAAQYSKLLFTPTETVSASTNYSVLDLSFSDQSLQYNGILTSKDSISIALDAFKHTIPQKTNTLNIAPYNTTSLISIAFDDFSVFNSNLSLLKKTDIDSTKTFLNFANEIALIDNALLLHTLDPNIVLESIDDKLSIETFREIEIYEFSDPAFFKSRLQPFITYDNAQYFSVYENFIMFSDSVETLKAILTNALNNNILANSDAFNNINPHLSGAASLFIFKNADALSDILDQTYKGYNANAVQYVYENDFAHVNGIIQKFKKRAASNSVSEAFVTELDLEILSDPQTLQNHVTKAHDIAVQDISNRLHLISSSGKILWKKQLQGKILGKIEQIDMYKNGRLQLAFATKNRLYVIDRNGNDVAPFPLKFNDDITAPLSVFDYDKRKNYRLLITQGKNLLMYDARGTSVTGFDYNSNGGTISTQPKHFRIGTRDYIAFAAGETLMILNRQGAVRIKVKDKIQFSDNALYLYQNKFTTTNTLGQLVQVDTQGNFSTTNLNLPENHRIEATSKTLVSLTENKLQIKSRTIDLDYGEYTEPKVFYLDDKIYVTTTDLQAKKVYLFDSQAKPIPNFPVFGTAAADLQHLDKDAALELITQSDAKHIVVYKLH